MSRKEIRLPHGRTALGGLAATNAKHQVSVLSGGHVRLQAVDEARWGEIRPYRQYVW